MDVQQPVGRRRDSSIVRRTMATTPTLHKAEWAILNLFEECGIRPGESINISAVNELIAGKVGFRAGDLQSALNSMTTKAWIAPTGHGNLTLTSAGFKHIHPQEEPLMAPPTVEATDRIAVVNAAVDRRQAAFKAFQHGASVKEACARHAVEQRELEDMIRLQFDLNVDALARAIAIKLRKTKPAEIEKIVAWLRQSMIWLINPDADLVSEALSNVDFSS